MYQSGKIQVLHTEHLPLKIKKENRLLTRQSLKMFMIKSEMSLKVKIPQDKRILQNCSCRCGPRPPLFSGTQGWQSGWCWCFSVASVSTSEQHQRPAEQWALWSKRPAQVHVLTSGSKRQSVAQLKWELTYWQHNVQCNRVRRRCFFWHSCQSVSWK